jgi:uncharacterized protein (TIGR00288 family)
VETDPTSSTRIAVLIDCDNVSAKHIAAVLEELATYGVPTVKRAYGDWTTTQLTSWKPELLRNAIQPIQQFSNTIGKNSTDSALIIDAMDLLWQGNVDAFAIVSSDSDFTRLATRLRESGKRVYGLGRRKTPESLRRAVDQFIFLEVLQEQDREENEATRSSPAPELRRRPSTPRERDQPAERPDPGDQRDLRGRRLEHPRHRGAAPESHPRRLRPSRLRPSEAERPRRRAALPRDPDQRLAAAGAAEAELVPGPARRRRRPPGRRPRRRPRDLTGSVSGVGRLT